MIKNHNHISIFVLRYAVKYDNKNTKKKDKKYE